MLVQVNYYAERIGGSYDASLTTPLRLYISPDGGSTWNETDFNQNFDGRGDVANGVRYNRVDASLAFDRAGNLYIMYLGQLAALNVDRINAASVATLASGGSIPQLTKDDNGANIANVAWFNSGNDAPSMAVGPDPSYPNDTTRTAVYVFDGTGNNGIFAWHGSSSDSFHYNPFDPTTWLNATTIQNNNAQLEPGVVAPDGTLYGLSTYSLYHLASPWGTTPATSMTLVGTVSTDGNSELSEPEINPMSRTHMDSTLVVDPTSGTLWAAWQEQSPLSGSLSRILVSQFTPNGSAGSWSTPTQIDPTPGIQLRPALAIDPVSDALDVLYFTTNGNAAGDTTDVWPRMATQSSSVPGGWAYNNLTTAPLAGLTDNLGPDYAAYTGLAMNNGVGTAVWSGLDSTLASSFAAGAQPYVAEAVPVAITIPNEKVLTVAPDPGSGSTGHVTITRDSTGTLTVSIDGVAQSFDTTQPIGQIVVDGYSVVIDDSHGEFLPQFGLMVQPPPPGSVLPATSGMSAQVISGATQTAAILYGNTLAVDGGIIAFNGISTVEVDGGSGNGTLVNVGSGLSSVTFQGGPGNDTLTESFDMSSSASEPLITFIGGGGTDRLVMNNTGSASAPVSRANHLFTLGGRAAVAYDANLSSIEVDGPNTLAIDLSQPIYLPPGTVTQPGFIDRSAAVAVTGNGESGDVIGFQAGVWTLDGCNLQVPIGTLDLSHASLSTLTLGNAAFPFLSAGFTVDLGGGANSVVMSLYTYYNSTTYPVVIQSAAGNDTIHILGYDSGSTNHPTPFTYVGGSGNDALIITASSFNNFTFTGGTGHESLTLDYSLGKNALTGNAIFSGNAAGTNSVALLGDPGHDDILKVDATTLKYTNQGRSDNLAVSNIGLIQFHGGGTHVHTLDVSSGNYTVDADTPTGTPNVAVSVDPGAAATFNSTQHLSALTVNGTATANAGLTVSGAVAINSGGAARLTPMAAGHGLTDNLGSLTIGANSSLDIGNNSLLIQNVPNEYVIGGYLANGYAAAYWNGVSVTGGSIKSITAYSDNSGDTSIGFGNSADFTFAGSPSPYAVGGALALTGNQVIVKPTLAGDLMLTGSVGSNELAFLLASYGTYTYNGTNPNTWAYGNIDYSTDGLVGPNDLALLLATFGLTLPAGP